MGFIDFLHKILILEQDGNITDELIRAINNRYRIMIYYHADNNKEKTEKNKVQSGWRYIEPYILGHRNETNNLQLRGILLSGVTKTKKKNGDQRPAWETFNVTNIQRINVLDGTNETNKDQFNKQTQTKDGGLYKGASDKHLNNIITFVKWEKIEPEITQKVPIEPRVPTTEPQIDQGITKKETSKIEPEVDQGIAKKETTKTEPEVDQGFKPTKKSEFLQGKVMKPTYTTTNTNDQTGNYKSHIRQNKPIEYKSNDTNDEEKNWTTWVKQILNKK